MGGGWALEIDNFLGPVKWHRADGESHLGPKNLKVSLNERRVRSFGLVETLSHFTAEYTVYGFKSPKFIWAPCHVMCAAILIG